MTPSDDSRKRRRFGEISRLPSGRYRARYRGPDQQRHTAPRTFQSRMDAEAWLATQHHIVSAGAWRPRAVHAGIPVTLGEYARSALERRNLGPGTASLYQRLLSRQILPAFGDELVADISTSQVSRWYLSMTHTPTQRANAYALLKSILKDAVEDGLIQSTPARIGGRSPKAAREMEVLTVQQLHRYVAAVPVRHRVPLLLIGWCGLRSGEVRGLRVMDLELDEAVIRVRQAVVRLPGKLLIKSPKTAAGVRDVAIPPHLLPSLRAWRSAQPTHPPDSLLFPSSDGVTPLNDTVLRNAHYQAREAIGMPRLTIDGLRHTSAILAAQQGATTADLQARMGHATPIMALRYQHVAADSDPALPAIMSRIFRRIVTEPTAPDSAARAWPSSEDGRAATSKAQVEGPQTGTPRRTPESRRRAAAVRAWAHDNGLELSPRGRISREVSEAYDSAIATRYQAPPYSG